MRITVLRSTNIGKLIALVVACCAVTVRGGEIKKDDSAWGHLVGRIVCDCDQPIVPEEFPTGKDEAVCGKTMQSEMLLVNAKDGGLANVYVFLATDPKGPVIKIHPDYEKTEGDKVILDMSKGRFVPHCIAVRTTQILVTAKHDQLLYSPLLWGFKNMVAVPEGQRVPEMEHRLKNSENLPFVVRCGIHPWMAGWILVRDNPYMAVTDESGRFEIRNLPVGEWTFQLWHEKSGWIRAGKLAGEKVEWPKGRLTTKITADSKTNARNDLGELHVDSKLFEDAK